MLYQKRTFLGLMLKANISRQIKNKKNDCSFESYQQEITFQSHHSQFRIILAQFKQIISSHFVRAAKRLRIEIFE